MSGSSARSSSVERQERREQRQANKEKGTQEANPFITEDDTAAGGSAPSRSEVTVAASQGQAAPSIPSIHAAVLPAPRQPASDRSSSVSGGLGQVAATPAQAGGGPHQQGNSVESQLETATHATSAVNQLPGQPASARSLVRDEAHIQQLLSDEGIQHVDFEAFKRFLEYERRLREGTGPSSAPQAANPATQSSLDRAPTDVVIVTSSSSSPGEAPPRRNIVVLDSPEAEHSEQRQSVNSDDVPLVQLRRDARSSDEGTDGSKGSKSRVSWQDRQRGFSGHRCPLCGFVYDNPEDHNPFMCTHKNDNFTRTTEEWRWLDQFFAMQRAWGRSGPRQQQIPQLPQLPNVVPPPLPQPVGGAARAPHTTSARAQVRRDEAVARQAGVVNLGSSVAGQVTRDQLDAAEDAALEVAYSSDGYSSSVTSSSYRPSTSSSSLSSFNQRQSSQELANLERRLQEQNDQIHRQHEEIQRMMASMQQQQMQFQQQQMHMRMMPPVMLPMPPMPPFPGFGPLYQDQGGAPFGNSEPSSGGHMPDWPGGNPFPGMPPSHSFYHPQPPAYPSFPNGGATEGTIARTGFSSSASHVHQSGMSGAPELAPEQLGKIPEFNAHVKNYNAYALKAVARQEPHLSLAQTMRKHAFAIATTFTSQAIKRYRIAPQSFQQGDTVNYTVDDVLALTDEAFTRLYTECCSSSIEDPSQVHSILSQLEFARQTQDEDGPLPALMRAEATFRTKLYLLPRHALERCRPQELRDAFIKMFFTSAKFDTAKMDFQSCTTWEQVYQQLAYRAGSASMWYADVPKHKSTPDVSVTPTVSSTSPAMAGKSDKAQKDSTAFWQQEFKRLQKSVQHDPTILDQVTDIKKKAKILQKLRFKQTMEAEIRDQLLTAFRREQQRDTRERSRERQPERDHHQDSFRPSRESSRERRDQTHNRPYHEHGSQRTPHRDLPRDRPSQDQGAQRNPHRSSTDGDRQHHEGNSRRQYNDGPPAPRMESQRGTLTAPLNHSNVRAATPPSSRQSAGSAPQSPSHHRTSASPRPRSGSSPGRNE
jgi:hypothetical protein